MELTVQSKISTNAYYAADLDVFLATTTDAILGAIGSNTSFSVDVSQRDAWVSQIEILKKTLEGMQGTVFFEFIVPRIGSRIDVVFISGAVIYVIEFKVGESEIKREDINQVWDYALDLKNFHQASHSAPIVPILVATDLICSDTVFGAPFSDNVFSPVKCNANGLRGLLRSATSCVSGEQLDASVWGNAPYLPTPTIIEAAQALFAQHSVEAIARHDAGRKNLRITSKRVEDLVDEARKNKQKMIVFVTGVPGAGKTLVGLNVATRKRDAGQPTHAVFLSGNGPLVAVLREALTRDEVQRLKRRGQKRVLKGDVGQKVKAFIQLVHHFRDAGLRDDLPPADHVVIFDEAQRAWNREMASDFMRRKKNRPGFDMSEPEFLISYLDRHKDWAVVICLVGGGQEINRGEAGISAWLDAVNAKFSSWDVYVSPELTDSEYAAGHALDSLVGRSNVTKDNGLHLAVSMRSFRAENVAEFVKATLDCEGARASEILTKMMVRYPIALTRDLNSAKKWIRAHARGSERYGLVASSSAHRLKPHAIDIRVDIDPIHWFLNGEDDTRSSYYLEDAATEFQVQGLELDWVCVTWDADLRFSKSGWGYHSFVGANWNFVRKEERQQYLKNAYRVLLTRARQGFVIFVPTGEASDPTRAPEIYDSTFNYLADLGIPVLPIEECRCVG